MQYSWFGRILFVTLVLTIYIKPLLAADTSSTISGSIQSESGSKLPNVIIEIRHLPSATVKRITTNNAGEFRARGLRVGGPYTVIMASDDYETKEFNNVYLQLDDSFNLSATLTPKSKMERVDVIGSVPTISQRGSSSIFAGKSIEQSTLVNRDIKDVVRSNPLAVVDATGTELSIAGSNPKYNSLTLDGVAVSDTFGLNANGYPAQRPPISINAISQISIDYAPFNLRASNFTGGTINVVTKSGTNDFDGEVFYEWIPVNGTAIDDKLNLDNQGQPTKYEFDNNEVTYGAALSGPLVKDTLFFFTSFEEWSDEIIFNYDLGSLAGHRVTIEETQQVLSILEGVYGLTDSIGTEPPADSDKKWLVKFDWNINDAHRADFTYSHQKNSASLNYTNSSRRVNFASNQYSQDADTTIFTTHLFSDWTDNFSTEINLSFKDHEQAANTRSSWGEININTASGSIIAGQDKNRHGNVKSNQTTTLAFHGLYLKDAVDYQFGIEIEDIKNSDLYARSAAGRWFFDSIAEFESKAPRTVIYSNAYTNNMQDLTATIESTNYAFYAEASTELFDDFTVSGGLRYEVLSVDSAPKYNANYFATYGQTNTNNFDGIDILQPRFSFNWHYSDQLTLRGGLGRFSGGTPLVWFSNAYTNDGVTKTSATADAVAQTIGDPANVMFDSVPLTLQNSLSQGDGSTNTIAKDFTMPSDWRYQLAADVTFDITGVGDDFLWSTELLYVERHDGAFWVDQSRYKVDETVEGRTIWGNIHGAENRWDIQLTNSKDSGESTILTTGLNKRWDSGVLLNMSYTYQDISEVNPGNTSTAESSYFDEVIINRNSPLKGRAFYEIEHRLVVNLGYEKEFIEGYNTSFNLFFERRSGRPFSWTLGREARTDFGDQRSNTKVYLPYLPQSADDPAFDFSALSYQQIMAIAQDAGVAQYAGAYIPKYVGTQPWQTTMDLAITQELPGLAKDHKGQLYFIIDNLANLINDDWGKSYGISSRQQILFDVDINENGQYVLQEARGGTDTNNFNQFRVEPSAWSVKVGVKYQF
ncbi:TonB-dependent receptor [Aliiglaciecola litoralis]|uniref:TonB-dependent receptor n=1 Tax=Aliiglaciecola litoralis TaxID=582857 RepID=A0ABN1LS49_9ALTE